MSTLNRVDRRSVENRNRNCFYCGTGLTRSGLPHRANDRTVDHLHPKCRGGDKHDPANRVFACRACNDDKGRLTLDEYRVVIAFRRGVLILRELEQIVKFYGEIE